MDDGSKSIEQSLETIERMAAEGINELALTPHLDASRISEGPPPAHYEAFAALADRVGRTIRLHRGAEVMMDRSLTPRAVATRRVTLAGSRYLLCEFTRMVSAHAATVALTQVVKAGLVPVLAHPERYQACSVGLVTRWRELGAKMQVDANTLFQPSGRGQKARAIVAAGLADILAADNHGDSRSLAEPFRRLVEAGGESQATLLMVTNPRAIVSDQELTALTPLDVTLPLFSRIKGWFEGLNQ